MTGSDGSPVAPPERRHGRPVEVGRRLFLIGGSTLLLSACTAAEPKKTTEQSTGTTPTSGPVSTVRSLIASNPFYIAHRGSGDDWTEHTVNAYGNAIAAGAKAIEVSVRATADGVLICQHDANLKRTTGVDLDIASASWSRISTIRNDARQWLGPDAALEPIARFDDVLRRFGESAVLFIEDKDGRNEKAMLKLMDRVPRSTSRMVWKQWAGSGQGDLAASKGYRRWGYFTDNILDRVTELASRYDLLGVPHTFTDAQIATVVAQRKPVICWEVHRRSQRDHLRRLGVVGMMCSNIPYVTTRRASRSTDPFGSGRRASGDLPWTTDQGWSAQPTMVPAERALTMSGSQRGYLMGSLGPVTAEQYTLSADLRWPKELAAATQHAGLAFAATGDDPYVVGVPSLSSGYHAILRANGSLEVFSRRAGMAGGTQLASLATTPPVAGEWTRLTVEVTAATITVRRTGDLRWKVMVRDTSFRGGYTWLGKNYHAGPDVQFRRISVQST